MQREVKMVPHSTRWAGQFKRAAQRLRSILGDEVVAVDHIGSTSIPGIYAKPIIDILVEVRDIARVDAYNAAMARYNYHARGEFGIPGRRFFFKGLLEIHTQHVHIFQNGSPQIALHLNFRDFMRTHPQEAQDYSELKISLANQFPQDIIGYMGGKDAFIKEMNERASWWSRHRRKPRAVGILVQEGKVLVMLRQRDGHRYCVLPGGGVEPGESLEQGCLREVKEETGLSVRMLEAAITLQNLGRNEYYFWIDEPHGTLEMGGPEAEQNCAENHYQPAWISVDDLDDLRLMPEEMRARIRMRAKEQE